MINNSQDVLSQIVVYNKYAKYRKDLSRRETWDEIIDRYVAMMLKKYCGEETELQFKNKTVNVEKGSLAEQIIVNAQYLYDKKVLPSMRALQFAGPATEKNETRVYNCSFAPIDDYRAFSEIMFLLLSGCGCGYSVQFHHIEKLPEISRPTKSRKFLIGDSIEGWSDAVKALMKSYFGESKYKPEFDFSDIREKGEPLITAGGKAPGPEPLKVCLAKVEAILKTKDNGSKLLDIEVHDIICHIADAVLAGGIRRAALISLFSMDSKTMLTCKHGNWWENNPQRGRANNSAVVVRNRVKKKEFKALWKDTELSMSGEPGISFTNDSEYGFNPCHEISLRPYTFCNLCEINAGNISTQEDLNNRARVATFFSTLQAGFTDFHYLRPIWKTNTEKDSLVGVGMTGICNGYVLPLDLTEAVSIIKDENVRVAGLLGINRAARTSTIKPSGCSIGSTMLITSDGLLTLEEIGDINGEEWQSHSINVSQEHSMEKSDKFYVNGKVNTKKIYTSGGIELESSLTHQYKVLRDGEYVWVKTPELIVGDILPFKVGGYDGGSVQFFDSFVPYNSPNLSQINQPEWLNKDIAWFLGLYLADGSTHKKGIRIAGDYQKIGILEKAKDIAFSQFNISGIIYERTNGNNADLYLNSQSLLKWLELNGLIKQKTLDIEIPLIVRKSPKNIIKSYIDGYGMGDGSTKTNGRTFCTTSKKMASQLVVILRAIGIDAKCRLMPPTNTSYGTNMRYWISERKGRDAESRYIKKATKDIWEQLDNVGLIDFNFDTILDIQDGYADTYDISVPNGNTYIAESYVNHNTTSCVLSTSSGIHAWHAKYYVRNMQCAVGDDLYNYFMVYAPELIKVMDYDPKSAVIGIPMKAPKVAILREDETAIEFLERVKRFNLEWVIPGHVSGPNYNNVSATVSIKDEEWEEVGEWMWENRNNYSGISALPYDGGTYADAPFQDCTEYEYNKRMHYIKENPIDLTKIIEMHDNTNLTGEVACAGGACLLTY